MPEAQWRAVLAGAERLTVWPMAGDQPVGPAQSLPRDALAGLPGPVIAAGLDAARGTVPGRITLTPTHVPGLPHVAAIPMLSQDRPAALSRGAEVALAGYLSDNSRFDGVLLVIGAEETCWAHISAEEVVSFQSFLTPTLARALGAAPPAHDPAFEEALQTSLSRPERLAQHLASARAAGSGQIHTHLIGAEIAAAKPYWLGQQVVLLGESAAAGLYAAALQSQGVTAAVRALEPALLTGFAQAWAQLLPGASSR